ncbi:hypothetical protein LJC11_04445 [Bacteroidales bacterium OttesenSCG-928-I21]|nr:hypothetical protein [Bacteroidales bacterium OttesenSCG-928-I21]
MKVVSTQFSESIANLLVVATQNLTDTVTGKAGFRSGQTIGIATGWIDKYSDGNNYAEVYRSSDNTFYPCRMDYISFTKNQSAEMKAKAQNYLDDLLKNHEDIMSDVLVCSGFVAELEKKGYDCTSQRNTLKYLYSRLESRNNELLQSSYITVTEKGEESTLSSLYGNYLNKIANDQRISIAVTTIIIITAVVTLAAATAAYAFLSHKYSESKADLKVSDDLKRALQNVDSETRTKILADLENQVDKAYAKGVLNSKIGGFFGGIKNLALIAGGAFLVFKFVLPEIKNK